MQAAGQHLRFKPVIEIITKVVATKGSIANGSRHHNAWGRYAAVVWMWSQRDRLRCPVALLTNAQIVPSDAKQKSGDGAPAGFSSPIRARM
jgi:hypothetical protein